MELLTESKEKSKKCQDEPEDNLVKFAMDENLALELSPLAMFKYPHQIIDSKLLPPEIVFEFMNNCTVDSIIGSKLLVDMQSSNEMNNQPTTNYEPSFPSSIRFELNAFKLFNADDASQFELSSSLNLKAGGIDAMLT